MASKSKDVRLEQLRVFEKKLALRLQKLTEKGISKEKAQNDSIIKSLKSKIKETKLRLTTIEKFVTLTEALAKAKEQKLAEPDEKKDKKSASDQEGMQAESKPKKKESKKQAADTGEAAPKKVKKQKTEAE